MNKLFYFQDKDCNYIVRFLGIKFSIKHKSHFKFIPVKEYGLTTKKRNPQIIVSLTSFPQRINYVWKAISTILSQTLKPDKVVLGLADLQFPNKEQDLPQELLQLKDFGLEIKWCEDFKSLKKILPSLKEFPNDIIVTADDDLYYEKDWLNKLYSAYLKDKSNIYCHRIARLNLNDNKIFALNSKHYKTNCHIIPSYLNSIFGGSGCLFPPNSFNEEVFNINNFNRLAHNADDLWIWAMLTLNNKKIVEVSGAKSDFQIIDGTAEYSLCKKNKKRNFNKIYKDLITQYPHILDNIQNEVISKKQ